MRYVFLGATKFSYDILSALTEAGFPPALIFGIPKKFRISYSSSPVENTNFFDLSEYAREHDIPFQWIDSVEGQRLKDHLAAIREVNPDVILVMGWYYMIGQEIRNAARLGAWGIHASLLPKYAGGAPLVWAIINGETETGVTLFRMKDGVDDGDIIAQRGFGITNTDTIATVYEKATVHSREIILETFKHPGDIKFTPQDVSKLEVYPQRKPEDGEINWDWDIVRIKNFIRAQTKPYPGAWTIINGKKVIIWDADIDDK
jgi:methionyl-tRNA formyltransferase